MVFNATFNNIMVKETGVPGKNTENGSFDTEYILITMNLLIYWHVINIL
jgi:hypothetical protein